MNAPSRALILLGALASTAALAAAPNRVTLQGVLRTETGALQDGNFAFKVQIFPDATSTTPIVEETLAAVPVASGVFSLEVGASTPTLAAKLAGAADAHVQISVNDVALPKQPLSSVVYALHAATVPFSGIQDKPAPACADGQVLKSVSADGAPTCVPMLQLAGGGTATTASKSDHTHGFACVSRSGTAGASSSAGCQAGETVTSGGCSLAAGATLTSSGPSTCQIGGLCFLCIGGQNCPIYSWFCGASGGNVTATAVCCHST